MRELIKDYIRDHEQNILNDLQKLISFESITENKEENHKCLNWFINLAENMNLTTYKTTSGDVGIVEVGQGEETLGILVHLDVVSIGDASKWCFPTFEGRIHDGYIWGRGALDDKGAAMICLYALKALVDFKVTLNKKIWLIVGTSEETEWTDIDNFKREFNCPDYGFSPDGEFPIFNIEKGYADVIINFKENCVKDSWQITELIAGKDTNTIPSRAEIVLNGNQMIFEGVSTHSSTPELGINAIERLSSSILKDLDFKFIRFINEILSGDIYGGKLKFEGNKKYYNRNYVGETTIAPTVLSMKDGRVQLTINVRQSYGVSIESIQKAFHEFEKEYDYDFSIQGYLDPMLVSKELKFLSLMSEVYEAWGYKNSFEVASGTSYAKSMNNFVSWGPCFPEDLPCAHQENERISIKSLFRAMGIYLEFLLKAATMKDSLK